VDLVEAIRTRAARAALAAAAAGLAWLGVACARARDAHVQPGTLGAARDSVFVEVVNDNYYDARVHMIYAGGARHSLGTIAGNGRQPALAIPWQPRTLVVEVTLVIGGGVYRSDAIDVAPGDVVQVRVPANLDASGFFRRVRR
jgi:hypothetical protein